MFRETHRSQAYNPVHFHKVKTLVTSTQMKKQMCLPTPFMLSSTIIFSTTTPLPHKDDLEAKTPSISSVCCFEL